MHWIYKILESNKVPDSLIRLGVRKMLKQKLAEEERRCVDLQPASLTQFAESLRRLPIAIETAKANQQHYEVPTDFYRYILGPHLKYSCAFWTAETETLKQAEENMLKLTCARAELHNGMRILELGCGWGSLSLWMAEHYPKSEILAISNSKSQKDYIDAQVEIRKITNLSVVTSDINDFAPEGKFDRVVSVEMFEHLKNYETLLERINDWLLPNGKLFVHIFSHSKFAYHYVNADGNDWLTEHFFTGGMMPADNLLLYFQRDLLLQKHWRLGGQHYQKTAAAWLVNMDSNRQSIQPLLSSTYGTDQVQKWWVYWRTFFIACEELFRFHKGEEWIISHYLFASRKSIVDNNNNNNNNNSRNVSSNNNNNNSRKLRIV